MPKPKKLKRPTPTELAARVAELEKQIERDAKKVQLADAMMDLLQDQMTDLMREVAEEAVSERIW